MDLKPEESRTFEIGTKWNILNDRLNLTAAISVQKSKIRVFNLMQAPIQMAVKVRSMALSFLLPVKLQTSGILQQDTLIWIVS